MVSCGLGTPLKSPASSASRDWDCCGGTWWLESGHLGNLQSLVVAFCVFFVDGVVLGGLLDGGFDKQTTSLHIHLHVGLQNIGLVGFMTRASSASLFHLRLMQTAASESHHSNCWELLFCILGMVVGALPRNLFGQSAIFQAPAHMFLPGCVVVGAPNPPTPKIFFRGPCKAPKTCFGVPLGIACCSKLFRGLLQQSAIFQAPAHMF